MKQTLTESPCLAHTTYAKDKDNTVMTDASTTGLEACYGKCNMMTEIKKIARLRKW